MAFKIKPFFVKTFTANGTLSFGLSLISDASGSLTMTLPTAVGYGGETIIAVKTNSSSNSITLDGNGSETINGSLTATLSSQYDCLILVSDGSNWKKVASFGSASSGAFSISSQTGNFTATAGNTLYRVSTNNVTATLPASSADGSVRKFKMLTSGKTLTFAMTGGDVIYLENGTTTTSMTLTYDQGVPELISVSGGYDIT